MHPEARRHYELAQEAGRLEQPGEGELERLRTRDIVSRHFPGARCKVLDVGGAAGVHALWLAELGHEVHLVDLLPLHVEQARAASERAARPLVAAQVGDARALPAPDAAFDVVLLLGPLYHLLERAERVQSLSEARRVLRPGGVVFAATISCFAPSLVATNHGRIGQPDFIHVARATLRDGRHAPPPDRPDWFTTAYFHRPGESESEIAEAGLVQRATLAVEGPAWMSPTLAADLADPPRREALLTLLRELEAEQSLLGASAHVLVVATKA